MAIKAKAKVRLKFQSERQLTSLLDALKPETKASVTRRACVKLDRDGLLLVLEFEADDRVALRSTLNAYLRWVNSTFNVILIFVSSFLFHSFQRKFKLLLFICILVSALELMWLV